MRAFFNHWQRLAIGRMLTFLLLVVTGVVVCWLLKEFAQAVAFLQPVLIPLAVAAVIAFLVEPVVRVLCAKTQWSRSTVVLLMMGVLLLAAAGTGLLVVPKIYDSTARMVREAPDFAKTAEKRLFDTLDAVQRKVPALSKSLPPGPTAPPAASPAGSPADADGKPAAANSAIDLNKNGKLDEGDLRQWISGQLPKYSQQIPELLQKAGQVLFRAFGGFLGLFGVLLNAVIIPIYIYFLLTEARNISKRWADFLPLKDSQFKQEVVSTLSEIHGYLVAFFRGQLIVSSIDALLITIGLSIMGLNFSVVIGLLVLVLTFIPYLGIMLCYIPAILIAIVQYGDWQHPAIVVAIMFGVQTAESTIIAPKIVGESTGLHPLTVIVSVFAWELLLDGPIGALLAVPLTASLKVIMRRYVWERARVRSRILPTGDVQTVLRAGDRDVFGDGDPDIQAVPDAVAHPHEKSVAPPSAETANPPSGKRD